MGFWAPFYWVVTGVLKTLALVVFPILSYDSECESKPMDVLPWMMVGAVVPFAVSLTILVVAAIVDCLSWSIDSDHFGPAAGVSLVSDVFTLVWLCLGAILARNLEDCDQTDGVILALVVLTLICVNAILTALGLSGLFRACCDACCK